MDNETEPTILQITIVESERLTPQLIGNALKAFFRYFDVGETKFEILAGEADDITDLRKQLGFGI